MHGRRLLLDRGGRSADSRHATERMDEQAITEAMVEEVLAKREWNPPTGRNVRYDAVVDGRRLGVVVASQDETFVVTAFWYIEELNR